MTQTTSFDGLINSPVFPGSLTPHAGNTGEFFRPPNDIVGVIDLFTPTTFWTFIFALVVQLSAFKTMTQAWDLYDCRIDPLIKFNVSCQQNVIYLSRWLLRVQLLLRRVRWQHPDGEVRRPVRLHLPPARHLQVSFLNPDQFIFKKWLCDFCFFLPQVLDVGWHGAVLPESQVPDGCAGERPHLWDKGLQPG